MPRSTYQSILHNSTPYELKTLSKQGQGWFRQQIRDIKKNRFNKYQFIINGHQDTVRRLEVGKLYFFEYVAKYGGMGSDIPTSQQLPVWDRYPLVLPFTTAPNGFIGINLHYLPIRARAWLLDKLLGTANIPANKLRINWQILSSLSHIDIGQYATHRYLLNHITSPFRLVRIDDYANAIMLPFAGWYGKDRRLVNRFRNIG